MDAFAIVNYKTKEILLTKEFSPITDAKKKFQIFIMNIDTILNQSAPSPFLSVSTTNFVYYPVKQNGEIILLYIAISDKCGDIFIASLYNILSKINDTLKLAFNEPPNAQLVRDNIVLILLMIEHMISANTPVINEIAVLSSMVRPYGLTDKISEKIIGIAKTYDTSLLSSFLSAMQLGNHIYKYENESEKTTPTILFDFIDKIRCICDKKFVVKRNESFCEVVVNSKIPYNISLNILMNVPFDISSLSVDECVTTSIHDIKKKKTIDCDCKHGTFSLVNFAAKLNNSFLAFPFIITPESTIVNDKMNLSIEIAPKQIKGEFFDIDNIRVKVLFNADNNAKISNSNLTANIGDVEYNEEIKEATWTISKLTSLNGHALMKGSVLIIGDNNLSVNCNSLMRMECEIEKFGISGGKLVKVNVPEKDRFVIGKFFKQKTIVNGIEISF